MKFNVPAFKIGSGECNNYPLVEYIASFGKPVILSTGMNDIHSIKKNCCNIKKKKNKICNTAHYKFISHARSPCEVECNS